MTKPKISYHWMTDMWFCEIYHDPGDMPDGPLGMGESPVEAYNDWLEGVDDDDA